MRVLFSGFSGPPCAKNRSRRPSPSKSSRPTPPPVVSTGHAEPVSPRSYWNGSSCSRKTRALRRARSASGPAERVVVTARVRRQARYHHGSDECTKQLLGSDSSTGVAIFNPLSLAFSYRRAAAAWSARKRRWTGVEEHLIAGELQSHRNAERSFVETDLRGERSLVGPCATGGRRLLGEHSIGQSSLVPFAVAARDLVSNAVRLHTKSDGAVLVARELIDSSLRSLSGNS